MTTIATADNVRLFYNDWGSGRPVVLMHGWPLNGDMWADQAVFLAEHSLRVIMYDRRGFGRSDQPWNGYDYDTFAADVAAVMDQLNLQDATLVGFSMASGEVARYLTGYGSKRVSKAALISSDTPYLLKADDNPHGLDKSIFDGMCNSLKQDRANFLAQFSASYFGNTQLRKNVSSETIATSVQTGMQASLRATLECISALSTTDFRADMAAFNIPTLIIHGTADQTSPIDISARVTAKMIAGSRLVEYEGEPHALYATAKERLNRDLLEFVSS